MNFFKKLFSKKSDKIDEISINIMGKDFPININDEALKQQEINYQSNLENMWIGQNEIESIRDDGYIIHKRQSVSQSEKAQIKFYGFKNWSNDSRYCVVSVCDNDFEFNLSLVFVETGKILFSKKLNRPKRCIVNKEGFVICEEWGSHNSVSCNLIIYDSQGNEVLRKRHNSMIGDIFKLSEGEEVFNYNLNYSGKNFKITIPQPDQI